MSYLDSTLNAALTRVAQADRIGINLMRLAGHGRFRSLLRRGAGKATLRSAVLQN